MSDDAGMTHAVGGKPTSREVRPALEAAVAAVRARSAGFVEAEDVLRALAALPGPVAALLAEFGLDPDGIDRALAAERRHTLEAVGFSGEPPRAEFPRSGRPRWGASAHAIFDRLRGPGGMNPFAILAGVLSAELGTVPRALELAGVDRYRLLGRATSEAAALRRR